MFHVQAASRLQSEPFIVAVSGGCDSMVLLDLCVRQGLPIVVAHVNYGLRGEASDGDEQCVRQFCEQRQLRIEVLKVSEYQWQTHKGSLQEKARDIRYRWFDELLHEYKACRIMTAHHANDQTETMLLQFIRGGAGKSLGGMRIDNGNVLRPLLAIPQQELMVYASEHRIPWRTDASNLDDTYTRNKIRHHLIPLIEGMQPSIHNSILQRSTWIQEEQQLVEDTCVQLLSEMEVSEGLVKTLSLSALSTSPYKHILLWRWLSPAGFSSDTAGQIAKHCFGETTLEPVRFLSDTHEVYIQRGDIALLKRSAIDPVIIDSIPWSSNGDTPMRLTWCAKKEVSFTTDDSIQYLDAEKLTLPLLLRAWEPGDRFVPLGSHNAHKVSDFLTHTKIPAWQKRRTLVLLSQNVIAAVIAKRISESHKVENKTTRCLRIEFGA